MPCTERERMFSCFKCQRLDPVTSQSIPVDALTPRVCKIILVLDRLAEKAPWNWTGRHFVSSSLHFLSSYLHARFPPFPVLCSVYFVPIVILQMARLRTLSCRCEEPADHVFWQKRFAYVIKTIPIICMCRSSLCMCMYIPGVVEK